ncbi:MAG: hypothetical protein IT327_03845 [Anaerolineae bacterium]|nr:hypothetical protein [Anaerolineae bacterium]
MKNKFQYIMAGVGITLLVILGALTLLLPQVQAGEATENTDGEVVTAVESTQSDSGDIVPLINQNEPEQAANITTETAPATIAAAESLTESPTELPTEALLDTIGTKDNPQTNMDIVINMVKEFAQQQEETLLYKPGWLHTVSQPYTPKDQLGSENVNSAATGELVPREELVPDSAQFESWYHVDERGSYSEAISLVVSSDGTIHQESVLVDDQWFNLTLQARGFVQAQYQMRNLSNQVILPISDVANSLDSMQTQANVKMWAYLDNEQYIVTVEESYEQPLEDSIQQTTILSGKIIYSIDASTGQLLSTEVQLLNEDGNWHLREKWDHLVTEFMPGLPEDMAQLYANALSAVGKEQ